MTYHGITTNNTPLMYILVGTADAKVRQVTNCGQAHSLHSSMVDKQTAVLCTQTGPLLQATTATLLLT